MKRTGCGFMHPDCQLEHRARAVKFLRVATTALNQDYMYSKFMPDDARGLSQGFLVGPQSNFGAVLDCEWVAPPYWQQFNMFVG